MIKPILLIPSSMQLSTILHAQSVADQEGLILLDLVVGLGEGSTPSLGVINSLANFLFLGRPVPWIIHK